MELLVDLRLETELKTDDEHELLRRLRRDDLDAPVTTRLGLQKAIN